MYSLNIDNIQYNNYNTVKSVRVANVTNPIVAKSAPAFKANHPQMTQVPYNSALTSAKFRTELVSNDEKLNTTSWLEWLTKVLVSNLI